MKITGIALIALGALDLILWVINGFDYGWLEFLVGYNFISTYGAWFMILGGVHLYRLETAKEAAEVDEVSDLEDDEDVIFKSVGSASIVTVTNRRIIYRTIQVDPRMANAHEGFIWPEKETFNFDDIASIRSVRFKDTAKDKWYLNMVYSVINSEYGVQLTLHVGEKKCFYAAKPALVAAHVNKFINSN